LGTGLVNELWGQLYEEAARGALAKLENVLPDDQRDEIAWARRALITTGLYRPGLGEYAPVLQTLRGALHQQKRLHLVYQSASRPEPGAREVDPYALAHSRGWWYLVGFCHQRQAVRAFRVDRIRAVAVLEAGFETPPGFDARQHLNLEAAGAPVRVRLRFAPEAAHLALNNRPAWETVESRPDGGVAATISVPDLMWAASLSLSYGPAVTVEEPDELRRLVAEWARAVAAYYPLDPKPGLETQP
jgi:predicted DNA-binding transcriptional regulator YafY